MSVSPTHPASREAIGAENRAKIKIYYELSIINHKEFHGSVEMVQLPVMSYKLRVSN